MTPADLSRLEALAREATPGPWLNHLQDERHGFYVDANGGYEVCSNITEPDAAYIAAANALTGRLRAAVARVRGE
jgi:hypothetical protein